MKDKQLSRKPESSSIPLISPLLHIITVPVIVLLRRDFGYLFLRPKSIFLSLIWAFGLFAVYSCFEPERWQRGAWLFWFLAASASLYLVHLGYATYSQLGKARHDQFSGVSWLLVPSIGEKRTVLFVEPAAVIGIGAIVGGLFDAYLISAFLVRAGGALFFKELINQWASLRKTKQQSDAIDDAEETMGTVGESKGATNRPIPSVKKTSRKSRVRRPRATSEKRDDSASEKYAAILRMMPPYTLEQANENYRTLVKQLHPDGEGESSTENQVALSELTQARDFFREWFGGG